MYADLVHLLGISFRHLCQSFDGRLGLDSSFWAYDRLEHFTCVIIDDCKSFRCIPGRLLTALLGNGSQKSLPSNPLLGKPRPAGRPPGRPAGGRSSRTVVGGARGVSGAEKKII